MRLRHFNVRELILLRFICPILDFGKIEQLSLPTESATGGQNCNAELKQGADQSAYAFVIALSRSHVRGRMLFYSKDMLVYEGLEQGVFRNSLEIDTLKLWNEVLKPDLLLAWKQNLNLLLLL